MTRSASGYWDGMGWPPAPRLRIGLGFGPGRITAFEALVDSGSDVCLFPSRAAPEPSDQPETFVQLRGFSGKPVRAPQYLGSITAGDIRELEVEVVLVPDTEPILGRSFLNRCRCILDAPHGKVTVERVEDLA